MHLLFYFTLCSAAILLRCSAKHVVEVLVVLDQPAKEKWMKFVGSSAGLNKEIKAIFFEANEIYKSLARHGVDMEVRLKDIGFIKHGTAVKDSEVYDGDKIDADKAIVNFKDMMKSWDGKFDHAMLLTGYDLSDSTGSSMAGYAYTGTVCNDFGVSLVESKMTFSTAIHVAHELAHSLGSTHDGNGNRCDPNDKQVMSPIQMTDSRAKWFFSSCTAAQLKENLWKSCLSETTAQPIVGQHLGEFISPDDNCKRVHGSHSYLQRLAYSSYGDGYCRELKCFKSANNGMITTGVMDSPEGMVCGSGKRCSKGKCLPSDDVSTSVKDSCPAGDAPKVPVNGNPNYTCAQIISMSPANCRMAQIRQACCQSCE